MVYGVQVEGHEILLERLHESDPEGVPARIAQARRRDHERREGYRVTLDPPTCTCSARGGCKHIDALAELSSRQLI